MQGNKILLINDMCGYGKVATAAMLPILSYMGNLVYNLPTALVSNTLDYGKFNILETTDYITGVFPVWRELGFSFDAIATGFIASERQAAIVAKYCREEADKGSVILVDPIMGDEGKLYNGVTPSTINSMRQMVGVAHLIFPNYTEACYLTDTPYKADGVTKEEVLQLVEKLRALGAKSVLITSVLLADGSHVVAGYEGEFFLLPYDEIPVHFPGTGDIFSSTFVASYLKNHELYLSVKMAADYVYRCINYTQSDKNHWYGVKFEPLLKDLVK